MKISNTKAMKLFEKIVERERSVVTETHIDTFAAELYIIGYFSALFEADIISVAAYHAITDLVNGVLA